MIHHDLAAQVIRKTALKVTQGQPLSRTPWVKGALWVLNRVKSPALYTLPWRALGDLARQGDLETFQQVFPFFFKDPSNFELPQVLPFLSKEKMRWLQNEAAFEPTAYALHAGSALPFYANLAVHDDLNPLFEKVLSTPDAPIYLNSSIAPQQDEVLVWMIDHASSANFKSLLHHTPLPHWTTCFGTYSYSKNPPQRLPAQTPAQYVAHALIEATQQGQVGQQELLWQKLGMLIDLDAKLDVSSSAEEKRSMQEMLASSHIALPPFIDEKIKLHTQRQEHLKAFQTHLWGENPTAANCKPFLNDFCQWKTWSSPFEHDSFLEVWFDRLNHTLSASSESQEFKTVLRTQIPIEDKEVLLHRLLLSTRHDPTIAWLLNEGAVLDKEVIKKWSKEEPLSERCIPHLSSLPLTGFENNPTSSFEWYWESSFLMSCSLPIWKALQNLHWRGNRGHEEEGLMLLTDFFEARNVLSELCDYHQSNLDFEKVLHHRVKIEDLINLSWSDKTWHDVFKTINESLSHPDISGALYDYLEGWKIQLEHRFLKKTIEEKEENDLSPSSSMNRKNRL